MASFNKIPMFSKEDYDDWKIRMQAHLAAQDDDMWYVITDGPIKILNVNTAAATTEGAPQMVEKHRSEWAAEDKKKANPDNTKENKLTVAIQKFDNAKTKPGETLVEFDERFSGIIIELTSLGKKYSNREIALKVMRALPRKWDVKTIAVRESKDLNKLELHDLFTDLKVYEFELGIRTEEEPSTSQQTKALAATTVTLPVEEYTSKKSAEQLSNDAMSLFVKKFSKFMRKNQSQMNKPHFNKDHTDDGQACFNCGKKGHFIAECNRPRTDEKKSKDRRWVKDNKRFIKKKNQRESEKSISEESSSESEDEKVECLMAKEDQESTDEMVFDFNSVEFTREDLVTSLHEMVNEFKGLSQQFSETKTEKQKLKNKLTLSSCSQQKEVDSLKKPVGDRIGLGYSISECSTSGEPTQPLQEKDNLKPIKFVRSSAVYEHDKREDQGTQNVNLENNKRRCGLGYVEIENAKSNRSWLRRRPNTTGLGWASRESSSTGYHSKTRHNHYHNSRPVQKRYRLSENDRWSKQHTEKEKTLHTPSDYADNNTHFRTHHEKSFRIIQISKKRKLEESIWFLDSGCSRHMTGNKDLLSEVINYKGLTITFGDNSKGRAVGKGKIIHDKIIIKDVLLIENLCYNLISISQLCDSGYTVEFQKLIFTVKTAAGNIMLTGLREQNTFKVKWNDDCLSALTCFIALNGNKNLLWHKRLNHLNFKSIATISKLKLVSGLPNIDFAKDRICNACQLGKQVRSSFKSKRRNSSARCLELLHMDLFGPIPVMSLGGKKYTLVVINDFSRFTWVIFPNSKDQTATHLIKLLKRLQNEKSEAVDRIRSDRGIEFLNQILSSYLEDHGIKHELSAARSPQQTE
ncbi:uncharacterized protein [Primulina huaijiensis]|uniref:uncharacterized protein n=1 Tax=Primulina huaijiensis TaxID=1492673 RepID=UPI003CC73D19